MNTIIPYLTEHTPLIYLFQSFWRDEAFSYLIASLPVSQIILRTAQDFNPPLYYLLLHYWIFLVGHSDSGIRLLSFLFHIGTTYISYHIGKTIHPRTGGWITACLVFLHPMLLYYSFEARMYSLYALCTAGTLLSLIKKRGVSYTIWCTLGLYTHSYFLFIPMVVLIKDIIKRDTTRIILHAQPLALFLPWIPVLVSQFGQSQQSWIYPISQEHLYSIMGNIFTGYEGTPDGWWETTRKISWGFLLLCIPAFFYKPSQTRFLIALCFLPLIGVILYSLFEQPLYVNRYFMYVAVIQALIISTTIQRIPLPHIRIPLAIGVIISLAWHQQDIQVFHKKQDFRSVFQEINVHARPEDVVLTTMLSSLEAKYYYRYPDQVFIYNPDNIIVPKYIGITTIFPDISRSVLPPPPARMIFIEDTPMYEIRHHTAV